MTRSKFSTKAVLLATGIGLSTAAFAGSQPAAAQSYTCPAGTVYDPTYGCTNAGADDFGYDYGYPYGYGYSYPTKLRGHPDHRFGHMGMGADGTIAHHGVGFDHSIGVAHFGGAVSPIWAASVTAWLAASATLVASAAVVTARPRASILSSCMG
jgi:hypothetical protein